MNEADTRAEHIDAAMAALAWGTTSTPEMLAVETQRLASIYQRKLAVFDELKKSLLDQAFRGELTADGRDADRKLAEAGV